LYSFESPFDSIGYQTLYRFSATDEVDENHDDSDYQEDVNERTDCDAANHAKQPQNDQNNRDCV
jgi:hypothetical protein